MKDDPYRINESSYEQTKIAKSIERIRGQKFPSALEIGCGTGYHTEFLLSFSDRILCIDSSNTALKRAREKICDERVTFKQLDIVSGDLEEKFDLIFCSEVLYYLSLEQLYPAALKIINWLKAEGTLILVHARLEDSCFERIFQNRPAVGVMHSLFIKSNKLYTVHDKIEKFYRITVLKKLSE